MDLFDSYIDSGLKFIKKRCIQAIDQVSSRLEGTYFCQLSIHFPLF